jgi:hypothetical protein
MKRWVLLAIVTLSSLLVTGCGDGVALTREERTRKMKKGLELDARMVNDDFDLLLLNTRPSRLSRFRVD